MPVQVWAASFFLALLSAGILIQLKYQPKQLLWYVFLIIGGFIAGYQPSDQRALFIALLLGLPFIGWLTCRFVEEVAPMRWVYAEFWLGHALLLVFAASAATVIMFGDYNPARGFALIGLAALFIFFLVKELVREDRNLTSQVLREKRFAYGTIGAALTIIVMFAASAFLI